MASDSGLQTSRVFVLLKELMLFEVIGKIGPIDDPHSYFRFICPNNVEVSRNR